MGVLKRYVIAGALLVSACSLTNNWDPNGQPCRQEGSGSAVTYACDEGYSCLKKDGVAKTECVLDGSRKRNEECTVDKMCTEGLNCVEDECLQSCGASYFSGTDCRNDEFCKPYADQLTGFCSKSECLNTACPTGRICVTIKDNVGACLTECVPTFSNDQYSDNCGSSSGDNYCQAIGRSDQRRLVCLDTTSSGQAVGTFCNPIDNPCAAGQTYEDSSGQEYRYGLTCVNAQCRELCDSTVDDPTGNDSDCGASDGSGATYCCKQLGATNGAGETVEWGVCLSSASVCTSDAYPGN